MPIGPQQPAGDGSSFSRYVALLTQSATDAPVATVLENDLGGTVVWTYNSVGVYAATLAGAFADGKTLVFIGGSNALSDSVAGSLFANITSKRVSADAIELFSRSVDTGDLPGVMADGLLLDTEIEIRVYP